MSENASAEFKNLASSLKIIRKRLIFQPPDTFRLCGSLDHLSSPSGLMVVGFPLRYCNTPCAAGRMWVCYIKLISETDGRTEGGVASIKD